MILAVARDSAELRDLCTITPVIAVPGLSADVLDRAGVRPAQVRAVLGASSAEDFSRFPQLQWVHSGAAGVDAWLESRTLSEDVVLTSAAGNGAIPLAEHAMLLMLMLDRDVPRWLRAQGERRWDRYLHGELHGRTVGIVGLGNAGQDLARKAKAFGMRVRGLRRTNRAVPEVDHLHTQQTLHDMLRASDFVVVTAPLTARTRGMFKAREFAAIGPAGYFICVSRGSIADEGALLAALRSGTIAGAGLDAHGREPLPADSPFWGLSNVILTPHNGATTDGTRRRGSRILMQNLRRFLAEEPLLNVVDRVVGY